MTTRTQFTTPVGRFVQGDAFNPSDKDQSGAPRVVKTGPNAGQPNPQHFVAIALPKSSPGITFEQEAAIPGSFFSILKGEAAKAFPHLFPQGAAGPCSHPAFSYKVIDGDGVDTAGKPWSQREGFAGNWVVRLTRGASIGAPPVYQETAPGTFAQLAATGGRPRTGDYIRVQGDVSGNDNAQRPGLYVNLGMILFAGEGFEIVTQSGPSAAEAFGGGTTLPIGAAVPVAPAGAPTAAVATPPLPVAAAPPPVPAAPPPAPAAPVRTMLPAANGVAYEAYIAQGWTDDLLRQHGLMA